jgi:endonuclease/exonuclease/phosphatase family metal-dependent hydrolase
MTDPGISEFTARYMSMHEEDLAQLASRRGTLTEEAQAALDTALAARGIDLAALQEADRQEVAAVERQLQEEEKRQEKRRAQYAKIFFAVAVPIAVVAAIFRPERAYETLVSSIVEIVLLGALACVFVAIKKALNKRSRSNRR